MNLRQARCGDRDAHDRGTLERQHVPDIVQAPSLDGFPARGQHCRAHATRELCGAQHRSHSPHVVMVALRRHRRVGAPESAHRRQRDKRCEHGAVGKPCRCSRRTGRRRRHTYTTPPTSAPPSG